jgi:hypothetical protein
MDETGKPPEFFSLQFHLRFFPALLWNLLSPQKEEHRSPFADHLPLEYMVAPALCVIAIAIGFPALQGKGAWWGWILLVLGTSGLIALLVASIRSVWGEKPDYQDFRPAVFFFFVVLGPTLGLTAGTIEHSQGLKMAGIAGGLLAGYALGILAGLWIQVLGWMGRFLDVFALGGIAGMIILDLVLII